MQYQLGLLLACFFIMPVKANELSKIQQSISQQQAKIEEQKKKRDSLQSTLKTQEIQMGKVNAQLQKMELNLAELQREINRTEQEIKRLEHQEKEQKKRLEEQLDSAYRSGIHPSVLERLLSDSAKEADRIEAYYQHINQVRVELIQQLRQTQQELKASRDQLKSQQTGQQRQLSEQKKQEKALSQIKHQRENTIRALDKTLEVEQSRLESLKNNEIALRRQIEQAVKVAEQQAQQRQKQEEAKQSQLAQADKASKPDNKVKTQTASRSGRGLSGKYAMPVEGKIRHKFRSQMMGELRWNGIVITAKEGSPVKAIADGEVLMASWMNGYGFVVAINHGNGDISTYGYNQSLVVKAKSTVKAGETIAYVGNSGGQNQSGLYFAISRKGVAVNPLNWVK